MDARRHACMDACMDAHTHTHRCARQQVRNISGESTYAHYIENDALKIAKISQARHHSVSTYQHRTQEFPWQLSAAACPVSEVSHKVCLDTSCQDLAETQEKQTLTVNRDSNSIWQHSVKRISLCWQKNTPITLITVTIWNWKQAFNTNMSQILARTWYTTARFTWDKLIKYCKLLY